VTAAFFLTLSITKHSAKAYHGAATNSLLPSTNLFAYAKKDFYEIQHR